MASRLFAVARVRFAIRAAAAAGVVACGGSLALAQPPAPVASTPAAAGVSHARVSEGVLEAIGNTPLIELKSLSAATGCRILAKAEHMNPGGSVKDRPARNIVLEAERAGRLKPRHLRAPGEPAGTIVEGTGGNTGIGMALVAAARGYTAVFTMPANTSPEKVALMEVLGAKAIVCPVVPFSDEKHYYHLAKRIAGEWQGGRGRTAEGAAAGLRRRGPMNGVRTRG